MLPTIITNVQTGVQDTTMSHLPALSSLIQETHNAALYLHVKGPQELVSEDLVHRDSLDLLWDMENHQALTPTPSHRLDIPRPVCTKDRCTNREIPGKMAVITSASVLMPLPADSDALKGVRELPMFQLDVHLPRTPMMHVVRL
jgi:hypothetical protein